MKKLTLILAIVLLVAIFIAGCAPRKTTPTPSPFLPVETAPANSPGETGGDMLPNFSEGATVAPATVPEVVDACQTKCPGAQVQTITYATYSGTQCYKVQFQAPVNGISTCYVQPDGSVITEQDGANNSPGMSPDMSPGMSPELSPAP